MCNCMQAKKISIILLTTVSFIILSASAVGDTPQEKYISRYGALAVREMYMTGVPASITLAQGLLESGYGLSVLTVEGKNHFGIKCHNWTGKKMYYDDDRKGECFRVYDSDEDSFRDHSDFLRYQDRYKPLFENKTTDYKAWAYGLKKAGYATDPKYPSKLINLIETHKLYDYDRMTVEQAEKLTGQKVKASEESQQGKETVNRGDRQKRRKAANNGIRRKKRSRRVKDEVKEVPATIPESPLRLEEPKKYTAKEAQETFHFSLSREMYSQNGVPFIYSMEGETVSSIAQANELFVREVLKYNDLSMNKELVPGTVVYLRPKKNMAAKGIDKYIIDHDGEDLWEISQRFGVRLEAIYNMNALPADYVAKEGDTIILRGKSLVRKNIFGKGR